jgi:hypothetical protein
VDGGVEPVERLVLLQLVRAATANARHVAVQRCFAKRLAWEMVGTSGTVMMVD